MKLVGVESNRTAIAARVDLLAGDGTLSQEVHSHSSYYSVNDLGLHFGLETETEVEELAVRWPSG